MPFVSDAYSSVKKLRMLDTVKCEDAGHFRMHIMESRVTGIKISFSYRWIVKFFVLYFS